MTAAETARSVIIADLTFRADLREILTRFRFDGDRERLRRSFDAVVRGYIAGVPVTDAGAYVAAEAARRAEP